MCKSKNIKMLLSVCCVLLLAGLAAAHCGSCPGDKKECSADCKKACCAKDGEKKACSADCQKACCKKADDEKACSADSKKACCAKDGEKKACSADCKKACCDKDKKSCPADCTKACCKKADTKKACCKKAAGAVLGAAAPDFTAKDINGKDVQLSKLKGKIVVLEWANYDCPFVKPHYAKGVMTTSTLAKKYAKKDVVWLTINSTHYATTETNKKWAKEKKLPQTVVVDTDGNVGKLYKATNTPHLFIVDKKGKLAYQGALDNAPLGKKPEKGYVNYADKALAELTAGKPVSLPKTKPYGCTVKYAQK